MLASVDATVTSESHRTSGTSSFSAPSKGIWIQSAQTSYVNERRVRCTQECTRNRLNTTGVGDANELRHQESMLGIIPTVDNDCEFFVILIVVHWRVGNNWGTILTDNSMLLTVTSIGGCLEERS